MRPGAAIAALLLALPLAGLALIWAAAERQSRQGTEWDVPVRGFDPRDLLQGHYVQYQYDWPGAPVAGGRLCLLGAPPVIDRAISIDDARPGHPAPCAYPVGRANRTTASTDGTIGGRLYVDQARARVLERQMADPALRGVLRFRLRPDGTITPLDLSFRRRAAAEPGGAAPPAPIPVPTAAGSDPGQP